MTAHCATCNCADDERPSQPSTSSPAIRRLALQAAAEAVRKARDARTTAEIRNDTEETRDA